MRWQARATKAAEHGYLVVTAGLAIYDTDVSVVCALHTAASDLVPTHGHLTYHARGATCVIVFCYGVPDPWNMYFETSSHACLEHLITLC
jgi:hypothetical protein